MLGWEPVNVASDPGSATALGKQPTTDGLSVPICKEGCGKDNSQGSVCSQCLCNFYLDRVLVGNLVAAVNIEMWT